jgi:hypothetical protein
MRTAEYRPGNFAYRSEHQQKRVKVVSPCLRAWRCTKKFYHDIYPSLFGVSCSIFVLKMSAGKAFFQETPGDHPSAGGA